MDTFPFHIIGVTVLVWGVPILIFGYILGALHNIHTGVTEMAKDLKAMRLLAENQAAVQSFESSRS